MHASGKIEAKAHSLHTVEEKEKQEKRILTQRACVLVRMAERGGFEPPKPLSVFLRFTIVYYQRFALL